MFRQLVKNGRFLKFSRSQLQPQRLPSLAVLAGARSNFFRTISTEDKEGKKDLNSLDKLKQKLVPQVYDDLVRSNKVVVFMKGTPQSPRCGFSNAVVQIFRMHGVPYDAHDVLENEELREGIKAYTDWPTIPQVFINGEFVGGCDILLEMHQNGELVEQLSKAGLESELLRLKKNGNEENRKKGAGKDKNH